MNARLGRILSGLLVLLLAGSCSYSTRFVVTNASQAPMTVRLQFKVGPGKCPLSSPSARFPSVVPTSRADKWPTEWPMEREGNLDAETCTLTLQVPVRHSAIAAVASNYRGDVIIGDFPLKISIDGEAGALEMSGERIDKLFRRRSETLYVFEHGRRGA
jgi:hypothetical protein